MDEIEAVWREGPLTASIVDFELQVWGDFSWLFWREISPDDLAIWVLICEVPIDTMLDEDESDKRYPPLYSHRPDSSSGPDVKSSLRPVSNGSEKELVV